MQLVILTPLLSSSQKSDEGIGDVARSGGSSSGAREHPTYSGPKTHEYE